MGTDLQRVSSVMADFEKAVKQSLPEPKPDKSHLTLGENIATKTALTVVRVDFFFLVVHLFPWMCLSLCLCWLVSVVWTNLRRN